MTKHSKISVSDLVLSAIFSLQQKNGVSAKEITRYICGKRGYKINEAKALVKKALDRATENGIFTKKKGLYRIDSKNTKPSKPSKDCKMKSIKPKTSKKRVTNVPDVEDHCRESETKNFKSSDFAQRAGVKPRQALTSRFSRSKSKQGGDSNGYNNCCDSIFTKDAKFEDEGDDYLENDDDEDDDNEEEIDNSNIFDETNASKFMVSKRETCYKPRRRREYKKRNSSRRKSQYRKKKSSGPSRRGNTCPRQRRKNQEKIPKPNGKEKNSEKEKKQLSGGIISDINQSKSRDNLITESQDELERLIGQGELFDEENWDFDDENDECDHKRGDKCCKNAVDDCRMRESDKRQQTHIYKYKNKTDKRKGQETSTDLKSSTFAGGNKAQSPIKEKQPKYNQPTYCSSSDNNGNSGKRKSNYYHEFSKILENTPKKKKRLEEN